MYIAGVDIGNETTEVAVAEYVDKNTVRWASGISKTTGLKGTEENIKGIVKGLAQSMEKLNIDINALDLILINEAAPVIGDFAMETITETVITESTLIGHNPDTPGGQGIGVGQTILLEALQEKFAGVLPKVNTEPYIVIVPSNYEFDQAAKIMNKLMKKNISIAGAILEKDDGTLVHNRLNFKIPIVDEVLRIDKVPTGMLAAVEVAKENRVIEVLSNPYGIAGVLNLTSEETLQSSHFAKALIGNRSAVVIKTPKGEIKEKVVPAGYVIIEKGNQRYQVAVDQGARKIMEVINQVSEPDDIKGSEASHVRGMIETVRQKMAQIARTDREPVTIKDMIAVDTLVPQKVKGGLANETSMEKAVGISVMVKTNKMQMNDLAHKIKSLGNMEVEIGGVEGEMAIQGALTTPGAGVPLVMVDMGAGSTDASYMNEKSEIKSVHLAGAGNMVTMIIQGELGLDDFNTAEAIKKYPLAKVESLFSLRHENGSVAFFEKPIEAKKIGKLVLVAELELIPIDTNLSMETIVNIRRQAKEKVLVSNVIRALRKISSTKSINEFKYVILVGGCANDFELANMLTKQLMYYGITSGKGNIRNEEGPRNAVATGLILSYLNKSKL